MHLRNHDASLTGNAGTLARHSSPRRVSRRLRAGAPALPVTTGLIIRKCAEADTNTSVHLSTLSDKICRSNQRDKIDNL